MLLAMLALTAPPAFVHAVEAKISASHMHVVDWWADDLDGDSVPESIAFACNDDAGVFLVQRGTDLLEAPAEIDGRNSCPDAPAKPAWRVEKAGVIAENINVHHGHMGIALAIRDRRLVMVREDSEDFESSRDGDTSEELHTDYDSLTWSRNAEGPGKSKKKKASGPLVLITDRVRRPSKLIGESTLAATRDGSATKLHVHADRALVIRDCSSKPCKTKRVAKGDGEIAMETPSELEIVAGKTRLQVHFEPLEGEASFPPPPDPF